MFNFLKIFSPKLPMKIRRKDLKEVLAYQDRLARKEMFKPQQLVSFSSLKDARGMDAI